jgi:hypothetical protein
MVEAEYLKIAKLVWRIASIALERVLQSRSPMIRKQKINGNICRTSTTISQPTASVSNGSLAM